MRRPEIRLRSQFSNPGQVDFLCRRLRTTGRDVLRALAEEVDVKVHFLVPKI